MNSRIPREDEPQTQCCAYLTFSSNQYWEPDYRSFHTGNTWKILEGMGLGWGASSLRPTDYFFGAMPAQLMLSMNVLLHICAQ